MVRQGSSPTLNSTISAKASDHETIICDAGKSVRPLRNRSDMLIAVSTVRQQAFPLQHYAPTPLLHIYTYMRVKKIITAVLVQNKLRRTVHTYYNPYVNPLKTRPIS